MIAKLTFSVMALCLTLSVFACGPGEKELDNKDAAQFFGLADGAVQSFEGPGGITEEHTYSLRESGPEGEVYLRVVTRNGFVQDDGSMTFRANLNGLFATGFFDCVIRCAVAAEPFPIFSFPLAEGGLNESESEVTVSEDTESETRTEKHRFQSSRIETITTPRGDEEGVNVAWTRTIDGEVSSLAFSFVPDVGFVKNTGADTLEFVRSGE